MPAKLPSFYTPTPTPPPLYYSPSPDRNGHRGRIARESTSGTAIKDRNGNRSRSGSRNGSRSNTATPLLTPKVDSSESPWTTTASTFGGNPTVDRKDKEKDRYLSWHRKTGLSSAASQRNSNPLLGARWHFTEHQDEEEALFDTDFPLFPDSPDLLTLRASLAPPQPPSSASPTMTSAIPIDMTLPPRLSSASPRNHTSNLTFALQEAGASTLNAQEQDLDRLNPAGFPSGQRNDSISNMFGGSSYYGGSAARPISGKDRPRRESNTGNSFMGGMSWGGMSLGSWVRDDILMAGTSPALGAFPRSPSFHSSSYLPKMEQSFLKNYNCCDKVLDSLHDLLQHFEENHAQQSHQATRSSISSQAGMPMGSRRPSTGMNPAESSRGVSAFEQQRQAVPARSNAAQWRQQTENFTRTQLATVQDMDALEDMDMDLSLSPLPQLHQFGQQPPANAAPVNTSVPPTMTAQQSFGRISTPTTPSANTAFSLFSNPTVSSVNTPAMSTQALQQALNDTPDATISGNPGELDQNFNAANYMGGLGFGDTTPLDLNTFDFTSIGFGGLANTIGEMTIDDPAKRLFAKQGGGMTNQQMQYAMKNGQLPMDSELAKRLREQQLVGGLGGPIVGLQEPETKPFKCPVIGCEKAYKNQNGLKYHKQHGHQNQKLKENPDGSFSIVDPVTSIPYPGTVGMEKEKPYRCEICGKRYKNLNGLKYHRQHSPPCNLDLKPTGNNNVGLGNLQGLGPNANIAGVGLAGMADLSRF